MRFSMPCCGLDNGKQDTSAALDAEIPQKHIPHLYDRIAPVYDFWGRLTETRARARALEIADIKDGQDILEVAVGTGLAFYEIARRNPNGTNIGIDLSNGMLSEARKRLKSLAHTNYSLGIGTAFQLEMEDESIDTLVNSYMFDLIPHAGVEDILLEFKRVLRPGGRLILVNMTEAEQPAANIYKFIYRISPGLIGGCRPVSLSRALEKAGFKMDVREYHQQMLFPSEVIRAYKNG